MYCKVIDFYIYIHTHTHTHTHIYSCSVTKPCPTLYNTMDCSRPGFSALHYLWSVFKFIFIESMMPSNHLILCHPLLLQSFPASGYFPVSWLFTSGGQSIRASALASVLPVNIQRWFPLGLTGLISLWSKGLSRVFSSTVRKHQFSGAFSDSFPL